MDADEAEELLGEIESLRRRVAALAEAVADCRARRLHQEAMIARLREQLRAAGRHGSGPERCS